MTVFLTPDRRPFFGGTYFPKPGFLRLLAGGRRRVAQPPRQLDQTAGGADEALDRTARLTPANLPGVPSSTPRCAARRRVRLRWGGFGQAPKFPQTMSLELLLRGHAAPEPARRLSRHDHARRHGIGGIYDHLGGGFARYSVDGSGWCPTSRRCSTTRRSCSRSTSRLAATGAGALPQVVEETIGYVVRDLRHAGGRLLLRRGR